MYVHIDIILYFIFNTYLNYKFSGNVKEKAILNIPTPLKLFSFVILISQNYVYRVCSSWIELVQGGLQRFSAKFKIHDQFDKIKR